MDKGKIDKLNKMVEDIVRRNLYKPYPYGVKYKGQGPKVASSNLVRSIKSTFNIPTMELDLSMEDYAQWVDEGRRPGKGVPIDPLMQWIREKGLKGRDKKTGKYITNESLAFLISMGIKHYGIQPTNFLKTSAKQIESSQEINDLLEEIIAEYIQELTQ